MVLEIVADAATRLLILDTTPMNASSIWVESVNGFSIHSHFFDQSSLDFHMLLTQDYGRHMHWNEKAELDCN